MFMARMDAVYEQRVFREIMAIGVVDLLRITETQLVALHIINKALPTMSAAEITEHLLIDLCALAANSAAAPTECRDVTYEIFQFIVGRFVGHDPVESTLRNRAIAALLTGLNDADAIIQKRLFKFWSDEERLSGRIQDRMLQLLDVLYDPLSESQYLHYGAQLMLQPILQHADSVTPLFAQHISDENETKLTEYEIDVSWKSQNSVLKAPLFMESQQQQLTATQSGGSSLILRTSTSLAFQPTMDPNELNSTGGVDDQFLSLQSQSSLMFSIQPQLLDRRSCRVAATTAGRAEDAAAARFDRLRQRFLRDTDKHARNEALAAVMRRDYRQVVHSQRQRRSERQVSLFRRYRTGEYPDLMINSLALIMPLQGLVKYDKLLARQVWVSVFNAIIVELDYPRPFIVSASTSINNILAQTRLCGTVVFATLMELALTHAQYFEIPAQLVASFASTNQQMAIGIR